MIIDREENFNTKNDELVWNKIITIDPYPHPHHFDSSTHVVEYYRTKDDKEYYLFEYIRADNNGVIVNNFNSRHWNEVLKQIDISDHDYVYSQDVNDKRHYRLITGGKIIKRHIKEDMD